MQRWGGIPGLQRSKTPKGPIRKLILRLDLTPDVIDVLIENALQAADVTARPPVDDLLQRREPRTCENVGETRQLVAFSGVCGAAHVDAEVDQHRSQMLLMIHENEIDYRRQEMTRRLLHLPRTVEVVRKVRVRDRTIYQIGKTVVNGQRLTFQFHRFNAIIACSPEIGQTRQRPCLQR
jgi:hypothetical protein